MTETLAGLKVLASSSSSTTFYTMEPPVFVSKSSETTKELSKGGKMGAAATIQPMTHSSASMTSSPRLTAPWLLSTSLVAETQPINHPEVYIPPHISCFQPYQSHMLSNCSSKMPPISRSPPHLPLAPQSLPTSNCFHRQSATLSNTNAMQTSTCHRNVLIKPYPPDLTPIPSPHHPHRQAKEHLKQWKPVLACPQHSSPTPILSPKDLAQIEQTISHAWADSTKETYRTGLMAYHAFCDSRKIPEVQHTPASSILILSFILNLAGLYSKSAVTNYVQEVQAWHIMHGLDWVMKDEQMNALLKAAVALAPPASKHKPREPFTVEMIITIRHQLDLSMPLHAAVFACLTTTFYATAQLGEFTILRLDAFDPAMHIKPSDMRKDSDRQGRQTTNFHLPRTKAAPQGEDVYWAKQDGLSDPEDTLNNHFHVNNPPPSSPLFTYRDRPKGTLKPLTRTKFLSTVSLAAKAAGIKPLSSHGIHIGSTLKYLLHNLPLGVVKTKGRWASDAFLIYL